MTGYSPTFVAILATVAIEAVLARFTFGKWPHLASAYISGISVGILIKSPELWPFVMCGLISIASKFALRVGGRHLWNPSNFGVTALLFLAPQYVASLSVQSGNDWWPVLLVWVLGGLILYRLGRLHIPLAFLAAFVPLAFVRHLVTDRAFLTELGPVTWPMFQLYIFFMITDPKTTTRWRWSQVVVVVAVALVDTVLRLVYRDVHAALPRAVHCRAAHEPGGNPLGPGPGRRETTGDRGGRGDCAVRRGRVLIFPDFLLQRAAESDTFNHDRATGVALRA